MSQDSHPTREPKEFSTTEEARKQIWKIKDIALTTVLLALAVSLIAAGIPSLLDAYFAPVVPINISWITTSLGTFLLVVAAVFIFKQYRPKSTLTKQTYARLFYLVGEGTAFPMSTQYYPQQMAKIAFPTLVESDPILKKQMQDINPSFQADRSVSTEFNEFLLIFWLHTNLRTHKYSDSMKDVRKIDISDLDERLQNNTFIDFFSDFDSDNLSARQFSQLQPSLPKDVDIIYHGPDELEPSKNNMSAFAITLDGDWCTLKIQVTTVATQTLPVYGINEYRGMPLDQLDVRKISHYMNTDQGPVREVTSRVDVTVDYSFRHLLFGRYRSYDPNAYISWMETTAQRLISGHNMGGWSWIATAERIQDNQLDDIQDTINTIQRSLDQAPDPSTDTVDDDFFQDHLDAVEEQWQQAK